MNGVPSGKPKRNKLIFMGGISPTSMGRIRRFLLVAQKMR